MVLCSIACTVSEANVLNHYTHSLSTCFKECVCRASVESSFSLVSTRPTSTQPFSTQTSGRHQVLFPKTKLTFIPLPMSLLSLKGTLFCQNRSHPLHLPLPSPFFFLPFLPLLHAFSLLILLPLPLFLILHHPPPPHPLGPAICCCLQSLAVSLVGAGSHTSEV